MPFWLQVDSSHAHQVFSVSGRKIPINGFAAIAPNGGYGCKPAFLNARIRASISITLLQISVPLPQPPLLVYWCFFMNNLPSRSTDPVIRALLEQSDDVVRRARARTRRLHRHHPPSTDVGLPPLLHLITSKHRQPAILALLEHGMGQYFGAEPLAPLRDRDLRVLDAWFTDDSMQEIVADITENLENRHPEPCWDDYALGFLESYL